MKNIILTFFIFITSFFLLISCDHTVETPDNAYDDETHYVYTTEFLSFPDSYDNTKLTYLYENIGEYPFYSTFKNNSYVGCFFHDEAKTETLDTGITVTYNDHIGISQIDTTTGESVINILPNRFTDETNESYYVHSGNLTAASLNSSSELAFLLSGFSNTQTLLVLNADGSVKYAKDASDYDNINTNFSSTFLRNIILTDESYVIIDNNGVICILDPDGNAILQEKIDKYDMSAVSFGLQQASDGTIIYLYANNDMTSVEYRVIDPVIGTISEPVTLPYTGSASFNYLTRFFTKDIYFVSDGLSFYRYDKDGNSTKLFDWTEQEIIGMRIDALYIENKNSFYVMTQDPFNGNPEIAKINYCSASEVTPKTEITLACAEYEDGSLRALQTAVTLFNRKSTDYKVTIAYYDPENQSAFSLNQQIANDMMNGKQIDLILFHKDVTMEYFDNLGILGDWYPLMDSDSAYTHDAFLDCILAAYETADGTLPVLTTDFGLTTMVGAAENFGGKTAWTYAECADFIETLDWDQIVLQFDKDGDNSDAMLVLKSFLPMVLDDYIDETTGTCTFDSDSFAEFLTLCTQVLINHETAAYKHTDGIVEYLYESSGLLNEYRKGKTILFNKCDNSANGKYSVKHPSDVMNILDNFFNTYDEVTFIGYPLPDGTGETGTAVTPWIQLGLTANAEHVDGAWEFVKSYLDYQSDREQTENNVPYLPCTESALDALLDAYETYTYLSTGSVDIQEFTEYEDHGMKNPYYLPANTEVRGILTDLLAQTTRRYSGNDAVMDIIFEEAAYYFAGVNALTDVTDRIQSRVGIYLSEHQ